MRKFGRLGCLVLAFMMIFTTFTVLNVSAAETEVWKVSAAMSKDVPVEVMNGITVTAAEDLRYSTGNTKIGDVTFTGNLQNTSNTNGVISENGATGPVLKISTTRTGVISIAAKVSATDNKGARAVNVNDIKTYVLNAVPPETATMFFSFDIEAGQSYYFYGVGTKPTFYGATFVEKEVVSANAGDTVTVKTMPNSNALLGNIRLGDDNIAITDNSSTFVMPDDNVALYVDFVSDGVKDEIEALSFDLIKGVNESENLVYDNLELFDTINTSIGDPDVSWTSSNEAVISKSGEVNPATVDTQVEFTGVFSYQDYPNIFLYKTFNLTVPADTDDEGAVAAAKETLTLGDTSSVKKNLDLPTSGRRNTTITWSSSNPSIVGADGSVNPSVESDNTVILTATISRGNVSDTKEFTIFVPVVVPIELERAAISNSNGDVVMVQADGDYLSHIVYTDSINNKTGKEVIVAKVYNSDRSQVLSSKTFNIKEYSENPASYNGDETIIYLDKDVMPVNADSIIEIKAFEDVDNQVVELAETYIYSANVASNPTIYVAGDSTACTYSATGTNNVFPRTGWAAVLQNYFGSDTVVKDYALSGRSSLDFLKEANYTTIKNSIKSGDYFIVQFGHNDSKVGEESRYTNPNDDRFTAGSYKKNIYDNYVQIALDRGAYPIITTSISRRRTSDAGLEAYVNAAKELGKELGLPVIDLYSKVNGYINTVGAEQAKDIYNYVYPQDSRFMNLSEGEFTKSQYYANGTTDDTHINIFGAKMISQWFCDELERVQHTLVGKRNDFTMSLSDIPSYANAATASVASIGEFAVSVASIGDTYKITLNYDKSLGSIEIITGTSPISGYVINSAKFNESGKLMVDYKSDGAVSGAKMIVATYSDNEENVVENAAMFDLAVEGNEEFAYDKPESGITKLYIWDDTNSINPLSETYIIE